MKGTVLVGTTKGKRKKEEKKGGIDSQRCCFSWLMAYLMNSSSKSLGSNRQAKALVIEKRSGRVTRDERSGNEEVEGEERKWGGGTEEGLSLC